MKTSNASKVMEPAGKGSGGVGVPLRAPLVELGAGAIWLVGLAAGNQVVAMVFPSNPLATVVVQAVLVDLGVGRVGVRWDPGADDKTSTEAANAARGIGIGAAVALGVTVVATVASVGLGWAKLAAHAPNTSLGLGLLRAAAVGVRDVLLYAGLPLYYVGRARGVPVSGGVVFGALAAGAALSLQPAATPANVALAVAVMGAAAVLWARRGSGWGAVGLVGGWAFFAGVMFRGGLFDVDWKKGALAPGLAADGVPAWIAAGLFLVVALVAARGAGAGKVAVAGGESRGGDAAESDGAAESDEAAKSERAGESKSG